MLNSLFRNSDISYLEKEQPFSKELVYELNKNILPCWMNLLTVNHKEYFSKTAPVNAHYLKNYYKSLLNTRILWTFSTAYKYLPDEQYLLLANKSYEFLNHYYNELLNIKRPTSGVLNIKVDSLAFGMNSLVEYYLITDIDEAIFQAMALYNIIEEIAFDKENNGYYKFINDDINNCNSKVYKKKGKKHISTHLYILEAYTQLHRTLKDPTLKLQIENLVDLVLQKMINWETGHMKLSFDQYWNTNNLHTSNGLDIKAISLIYEAAVESNNSVLMHKSTEAINRLILQNLEESTNLIEIYKSKSKRKNDIWSKAEAMTGYWYMYLISREKKYFEEALVLWNLVKKYQKLFIMVEEDLDETASNKKKINNLFINKYSYYSSSIILHIIRSLSYNFQT